MEDLRIDMKDQEDHKMNLEDLMEEKGRVTFAKEKTVSLNGMHLAV